MGALPISRPVGFPCPPSEPDVRLPPHPALHVIRPLGAVVRLCCSPRGSVCERLAAAHCGTFAVQLQPDLPGAIDAVIALVNPVDLQLQSSSRIPGR